jgi:DNA replication protein DnaC
MTVGSNLEMLWPNYCPPDYRDTDLGRLPCGTEIAAQVLAWDASNGLLLHGPTRRGKTRLAFLTLKTRFMAGESIRAFDSVDFGIAASAAYRDGCEKDFYSGLLRPQWVFLDDVGKCKLTARVAEALFAMVDKRLSFKRHCIFTTNFTGTKFEHRFEDPELGAALLARLRESCLCISI